MPLRLRPILRELSGLSRWPQARRRARSDQDAKIVLGAADTSMVGWISTGVWTLDVTRPEHFARLLGARPAAAFLAEHVWEHLDETQTRLANANCFRFLRPGGHLRLAVPDGLHPDPAYIERVRPGGSGAGADTHQCLYDHRSLRAPLEAAGFEVRLLEWWDEAGEFHYEDWATTDGFIERSRRFDARNRAGTLAYTSLIVDAVKPAQA